ncbi:hypothetical protein K402DRAFT_304702, partial [Aulographum hederae CBS 113979]
EAASLRNGYPSLAEWMAGDPDNETFIFRKFNRLAARNILHLQSELVTLEKKLDVLDAEGQRGDADARQSLRRWETFVEKAEDATSLEGRRMKILQNTKRCFFSSQIADLGHPRDSALRSLRSYMNNEDETQILLSGRAKSMLDDAADLAALRPPKDADLLSRFLQDHWPRWATSESQETSLQTVHFRERHVSRTVAVINIIVAAILLIGAILGLYTVSSPDARLGMISTFTVLFALSLGLLSNAKRAEIFAATAAYAAVLV